MQTALDAFGTVDIVINNAGILRDKSFAKIEPADFDILLDVHLRGAFHVSQPAFKVMKEKGFGRFVHTTSAAGLFGNFGQGNYAAAKTGLVGLSQRARHRGRQDQHHLERDRADRQEPADREPARPDGRRARARARQPAGRLPRLAAVRRSPTRSSASAAAASPACSSASTPGWFAGKDVDFTPEDVAAHIDEIRDTEGYIIPGSVADEMMLLMPTSTAEGETAMPIDVDKVVGCRAARPGGRVGADRGDPLPPRHRGGRARHRPERARVHLRERGPQGAAELRRAARCSARWPAWSASTA